MRYQPHRGFTLIEVLVTLAVLSVGIVFVLRAMNSAVGGLRDARDAVMADAYARNRLSEVVLDASSRGTEALLAHEGQVPVGAGLVSDVKVKEATAETVTSRGEEGGALYRVDITVWRPPRGSRYTTATLVHVPEDSL